MTDADGTCATRWAATAPAPVPRSRARPARGEQRRRPAGQLLTLPPGDVDARRHVQPPAAERDRAGDPRRWLTSFAPAQPRVERRLVGCDGEEVRGFLLGRDATGPDEPVDHGIDVGAGAARAANSSTTGLTE